MTKVLARLVDPGSLMELGSGYGRGLSTSLARIDGHAIGVLASQPKFAAGTLDPAACEKAVRMICLCDAFDLPLVFCQDCPGFFVGTGVEHDGMLKHSIRLQSALSLARTPKLTVILRKAYGMAYFSLGGNDTGSDAIYAWPGAEISFMDPQVAANVVAGDGLDGLDGPERAQRLGELGETIASDTDPYRRYEPGCERPLASWPTR